MFISVLLSGVETGGWAKFDYVKMPEYRWGILLAPQVENRKCFW